MARKNARQSGARTLIRSFSFARVERGHLMADGNIRIEVEACPSHLRMMGSLAWFYFSSGLAAVAGSWVQFWRITMVWSVKNVRRPVVLNTSGTPVTL